MLTQDIFIILMGTIAYQNIKPIIEEVFRIDFSQKPGLEKYLYPKEGDNEMVSNKERNIWSVYHPAWPNEKKFSEKKIDIVLDEL